MCVNVLWTWPVWSPWARLGTQAVGASPWGPALFRAGPERWRAEGQGPSPPSLAHWPIPRERGAFPAMQPVGIAPAEAPLSRFISIFDSIKSQNLPFFWIALVMSNSFIFYLSNIYIYIYMHTHLHPHNLNTISWKAPKVHHGVDTPLMCTHGFVCGTGPI